MKNNILLLFIMLFAFMSSCDMLDMENKLDDPNNLTADQADIDMVLTDAQMNLINFTAGQRSNNSFGLNVSAMRACRLLHQFGSYTGPFSDQRSTALNQLWAWAYMGVLKNCNLVIEKAEADGNLNYHAGMAKVIKAYVMATLVDFFGDIPYSQAFQGADNFQPGSDDDADIYDAAFTLLDGAIADFKAGTPKANPTDLFYGNANPTNWIKVANTIKLKMHLNMRLIDPNGSDAAISAIVASGDYISSTNDDFQFQYSQVNANPDSRHPDFIDNYGAAGAQYYQSNYLIWLMKDSKATVDPRLRYYMYRQTDQDPSGDNLPCDGSSAYHYCYLGDAYWGRDHGDDDGVPNDGDQRTLWGVYPVGGAFDDNSFTAVTKNQGANGAGIFPILLSSYVNFMLAEYEVAYGTTDDAQAYFENGVSQSISKVLDFGAGQAAGTGYELTMASTQVTDYLAETTALFDAAELVSKDEVSDVIAKEYFIALYGNGIEMYNMYRRTGLPSNIESSVKSIGAFPRSYQYPQNLIDRNENFKQKVVTATVFWDNKSTTLN